MHMDTKQIKNAHSILWHCAGGDFHLFKCELLSVGEVGPFGQDEVRGGRALEGLQ